MIPIPMHQLEDGKGLLWLLSIEERDRLDVDTQVALALMRSTGTDITGLSEEDQSLVRTRFGVYDLYCSVCGTPGRVRLDPDATEWRCTEHQPSN